MRVRLLIAYDGTDFCGWQIQDGVRTVEGDILKALSRILNRSEDQIKLQGASRTDSGVHALSQVAHFDFDAHERHDRDLWDFVRGLNGLTGDDLLISYADYVPDDFNARFDARGKIYRYKVWSHRFPHPLERRQRWNTVEGLDVERMRQAASYLVGEHDFEAFRAASCQSPTTVREMRRVEVHGDGADIQIVVEGTAFLKYMVRVIAGTLVEVGTGRFESDITAKMLETRDRGIGGVTAPPHGLVLEHIFYPNHPWEEGRPQVGGPYMPDMPDW
ncbi:MAG: tRNA pseudouridine(38-40) synthase TruA [Myxococcota bacterium]